MKIFITGASGFIGRYVVKECLRRGFQITALSRKPQEAQTLVNGGRVTWVHKSLDKLEGADFGDCQCLLHLATHSASYPYDTYENCLYWNSLTAVRMFCIADQIGLKKWLVAGSSFEYGKSGERYEFIPVDAPLEPTNAYSASKAAASIAISSLAREVGAQLLIGRIFQVYGEGESPNRLWPLLRRKALAGEDLLMPDGLQVRDFIPVEQVARYFVNAVLRNDLLASVPLVENIGTGHGRTVKEFSTEWWEYWGGTGQLIFNAVPHRKGEIMRYVPEIPATDHFSREI